MRVYRNGCYVELSSAEIAEIEKHSRLAAIEAKRHPLSEGEVISMLLSQKVQEIEVDDNTSLRMKDFYPEWEPGKAYAVGNKLTLNGKLYKVVQPHTAQAGWEPENVPAMFTEICETHSGELDDPIPYSGNMALEQGKHYIQDNEIYICTRDTGNPVYHALRDLVGLYVEVV